MKNWVLFILSMVGALAVPMVHAQGTVARSAVTTEVVDREPTSDLSHVPASEAQVIFYTDLHGMAGQTILHRWMHRDEQVAEVSFNVGGPRWRVWSSKKMMPDWQGEWTVQVIDAGGEVVAEKPFVYGSADVGAAMAEKSDEAATTTDEGIEGSVDKPEAEVEPAPAPEITTE